MARVPGENVRKHGLVDVQIPGGSVAGQAPARAAGSHVPQTLSETDSSREDRCLPKDAAGEMAAQTTG